MKPRVSVVMAVLNGERFIVEAIQSIVDQNYPNTELVVVDDGSTDRTPGCVEQFDDRLRIVYVKHDAPQGIAASMNDGVRHSTGDFVSFLDHDDAWFPVFLNIAVDYLETHSDVGMVHSDFQTIDVAGAIIEASVARARGRSRPSGWVFRELFMDSFIVGNSVLIRRECFQRLGLFDESLRWGDYHMWLRIARHYKVDYIPQVLTKYRQHPTQSTRTPADQRADALPVGARAIELILEAYPDVRRELGIQTIDRRLASFYFDLAFNWFAKGDASRARVCILRALRLWPTNGRYLRLAVACYLGTATGQAARNAWRRLRGRKPQNGVVRGLTS